jgi:sodium/bile acid cotransporter 3/5
MCPLYPFHLILLYLCLLLPLLLAVVEGAEVLSEFRNWNLTFSPQKVVKLQEYNSTQVQIACINCLKPPSISDDYFGELKLALISENTDVVSLQHQQQPGNDDDAGQEIIFDLQKFDKAANWSEIFNVSGNFLGFTKVWAEIRRDKEVLVRQNLPVSVVRKKTIQSKIFSYSVAIIISLAYINMGCALDLKVICRLPLIPTNSSILCF